MNVLLDTNILGRIAEVGHPQHRVASEAADTLMRRGDTPCLVPQVPLPSFGLLPPGPRR